MITWIQSGVVVDPVKCVQEELDLIIERGKIKKILPWGEFREKGPQLRIINASGRLVVPGLVDMHVHLREPGHEYKETIFTGAKAGAKGGFTALACMPNTMPPNDCRAVTEFILEQSKKAGIKDISDCSHHNRAERGDAYRIRGPQGSRCCGRV